MTTTTKDARNDDDDTMYQSAVDALLSPTHQSKTKEEIMAASKRRTKTISDMRYYWSKIVNGRTGTTTATTKETKHSFPPMIHVTGTKGKGSTCCFVESILRHHGYRTGLFTSPHLLDIRERIRIDGRPIHRHDFADAYWSVRRSLEGNNHSRDDDISNDDPPPTLPGYFRMLTLMAYYVFAYQRRHKLDVWIVEVGMGGRYDATNFFDDHCFQTKICGVTLLDYDHVRILGDTLEKIAWEKGGIFAVDKTSTTNVSPRPCELSEKEEDEDDPTIEKSDIDDDSNEQLTSRLFILDNNTQGVVRMMKCCARIEGEQSKLECNFQPFA